MGTPDFACSIADAVNDKFNVIAVVTQPDKEAGRGKKITASPVKIWAEEHNIKVFQPVKVRDPEFVNIIKELSPDLIITAAFGQIIPKDVLDVPEFGCINVHASLLPKYRGASPIQQSLFNGDTKTGITLMYMNEKMDEGDIILQEETDISPDDNAGTLFEKLAKLGKHTIYSYAELLKNGKPKGTPQYNAAATYCTKISKEQGNIDWSQNSSDIVNTVRALTPFPGAYSFLDGKRIKIVQASAEDAEHNYAAGSIVLSDKNLLTVACGKGLLRITKLQPEGKSVMDAKAFLNGRKLKEDASFERDI